MITYIMIKQALEYYYEQLRKKTSEKSYYQSIYDYLFADKKDVLKNDIFTSKLNSFANCINDSNELLSDNDLFILLNFLFYHREYADARLLIEAFDAILGTSIDNSVNKSMTRILSVVYLCHEVNLFNKLTVEKLKSVFSLKNTLNPFANMLIYFRQSPLLNRSNFDTLISLAKLGIFLGPQFEAMFKTGLLSGEGAQANVELLSLHSLKFKDDDSIFKYLAKHNLLVQNFEKIVSHPCPQFINFLYCKGRNIMKQQNLDVFFKYPELAHAAFEWDQEYTYPASFNQGRLDRFISNYWKNQNKFTSTISFISDDEKKDIARFSARSDSFSNHFACLFAQNDENMSLERNDSSQENSANIFSRNNLI